MLYDVIRKGEKRRVMYRIKRPTKITLVTVLLGNILLITLAIGTNAGAQEKSREVDLSPSRNSGVSGTAAFEDTKDGVEVGLNVEGLPEGGVEHLAHIHEGASCQDDRNDQGGEIQIPLELIKAQDDGTGSSITTIEDVTVAKLFGRSKERYVNVHAEAKSDEAHPPGIACADLTPTASDAGAQEKSREVDLSPSRNSGVSGTAAFEDTKDGVEVGLNVEGLPEGGVEHLAHIHEGASCQDDRNDQGGEIQIPLELIKAQDDGTGSSITTIEDVTVAELFGRSKERYVNVHAEAKSDEAHPPGIACADLTPTVSSVGAADERTVRERTDSVLPRSGGISPGLGL